jgi:hypothetical protein
MRRSFVAGMALLATAALTAPATAHDADIDVLSSRADQVSGGDALVRIDARHRRDLRVTLNGEDISDLFAHDDAALVDGLRLGRNRSKPDLGLPRRGSDPHGRFSEGAHKGA